MYPTATMAAYKTFTVKEIISAFEKNPNCFSLDVDGMRENKAKTCAYFKALMEVDGKKYIPSIKFFREKTAYKVIAPEARTYEGISLTFKKETDDGLGKAIELISDAFKTTVKDLVKSHAISDDMGDEENTKKTKIVKSVKVSLPLKKTRKNMKTGDVEALEHPMYNIPLPLKRYSDAEASNLKNICEEQPHKVKEFDIKFCDVNNMVNGRPQPASVDSQSINTGNVHRFITRGSEVNGILNLDICSSNSGGLGLKFKPTLTLFVKQSEDSEGLDLFEEDDFALMGGEEAPKKVVANDEDIDPMFDNLEI